MRASIEALAILLGSSPLVAARAAVLGSLVPQDLQLRGYVIVLLGGLLPGAYQCRAVVRADFLALGDIPQHLITEIAGSIRRQAGSFLRAAPSSAD